jgi:lysylphosphatidylglycerol synthetase-like protein (DUF2156 family)
MSTPEAAANDRHPLNVLIGGPRGLIESVAPPLLFVATYLLFGLTASILVVMSVAGLLAILRLRRREMPIRIVSIVLGISIAATVAATTGRAADYFWVAVLSNIASGLAFAISVFVRWPLLGVIVGPLLGTGMRWRKDPDLLRAYSRATWLWVLLCAVRAIVRVPFIQQDNLAVLGFVLPFVFYGLVIAVVFASWWVIKRTLPADHPGIRRPRGEGADVAATGPAASSSPSTPEGSADNPHPPTG